MVSQLLNEEKSTLLDNDDSEKKVKEDRTWKWKHVGLLILVVLTQGLVLSADSFLYPFFPEIALAKGLSKTYIGIVFSAYELARFATSPIAGSLVSFICGITISQN